MALPFPATMPAWAYHKNGEARLFTSFDEFARLSDKEWANYPGWWQELRERQARTPEPPPPPPVSPVPVLEAPVSDESSLVDVGMAPGDWDVAPLDADE